MIYNDKFYEGIFHNGKRNGLGTLTYNSKGSYIGLFVNDTRDGLFIFNDFKGK